MFKDVRAGREALSGRRRLTMRESCCRQTKTRQWCRVWLLEMAPESDGKGFDALRESGDLPRRGVGMQDALAGCPHQLGLDRLEG